MGETNFTWVNMGWHGEGGSVQQQLPVPQVLCVWAGFPRVPSLLCLCSSGGHKAGGAGWGATVAAGPG